MKKFNKLLMIFPLVFGIGSSLASDKIINQQQDKIMTTEYNKTNSFIDFDGSTVINGSSKGINVIWDYTYFQTQQKIKDLTVEVIVSDKISGEEISSKPEIDNVWSSSLFFEVGNDNLQANTDYVVTVNISFGWTEHEDWGTENDSVVRDTTTFGGELNEYVPDSFDILEETISTDGFDFTFNVYSGGEYLEYTPVKENIFLKYNGVSSFNVMKNTSITNYSTIDNYVKVEMSISDLIENTNYNDLVLSINAGTTFNILPEGESSVRTKSTKNSLIENTFTIDDSSLTTNSFQFTFQEALGIDTPDFDPEDVILYTNKEVELSISLIEQIQNVDGTYTITMKAINLEASKDYTDFALSLDKGNTSNELSGIEVKTKAKDDKKDGLSTGAIIGITIGVLLILLIIIVAVVMILRSNKNKRNLEA